MNQSVQMRVRIRCGTVAAVLGVVGSALGPGIAVAHSGPVAETIAATGITDTTATLTARIQPNGKTTAYTFEYDAPGYARVTAPVTLPDEDDPQTVSVTVDGLAAGTVHHFRVVASWSSATRVSQGATLAFTTTATVASGTPQAPPPGAASPSPGLAPPAPGTGAPGTVAPGAQQAPPPGGAPSAPRPVLGRSVVVRALEGTVLVRLPGASGSAPIAQAGTVPVGAILDTRGGTVRLTSAVTGGRTQSADFHGGMFQVLQPARSRGMTELVLRGGSFVGCTRPRTAAFAGGAAATPRRRAIRRLWGRDRGGRFRTRGRNSVATVRGTTWMTTDTCAGTRTAVADGVVSVRDLRRKRTVVLRAGQSYVAPSRR